MQRSSSYLAITIWFRGHVVFFLICIVFTGPFALCSSFVAFFYSLPALLFYFPVCWLTGHIRSYWLRFGALLLAALSLTAACFKLVAESDDREISSSADLVIWVGLASTLISMVSVCNMLRSPSEDAAPPAGKTSFPSKIDHL